MGLPQGHEGERKPQQQPLIRLRRYEGLFPQRSRERDACGFAGRALELAETDDVADVFDEDEDDADAAYDPAA